MKQQMPTFKGHKGYQGQWVSVEEQEAAWAFDHQDDGDEPESIIAWKTADHRLVEVFNGESGLWFALNGSQYFGATIAPVPAAQRAQYAAAGVVAVLVSETGLKLGLTAERKATIEAALK